MGSDVEEKLADEVVRPVAASVAVPSTVVPVENEIVPLGGVVPEVAVTVAESITELP